VGPVGCGDDGIALFEQGCSSDTDLVVNRPQDAILPHLFDKLLHAWRDPNAQWQTWLKAKCKLGL
jgi:hypothetical protein